MEAYSFFFNHCSSCIQKICNFKFAIQKSIASSCIQKMIDFVLIFLQSKISSIFFLVISSLTNKLFKSILLSLQTFKDFEDLFFDIQFNSAWLYNIYLMIAIFVFYGSKYNVLVNICVYL